MHILISLFIILITIQHISGQQCFYDRLISCNETINCPDKIQFGINTNYTCQNPLVLMSNNFIVKGNFSSLQIIGQQSIIISDLQITENLTIFHQNYVQLFNTINIGNILLLNVINQTNTTQINTTTLYFHSLKLYANKMILQTSGQTILENSIFQTQGTICHYRPLILQNYAQSIYSQQFVNTTQIIDKRKISFTLVSLATINSLQNSLINASTIMIISQSNITINSSIITTAAKACRTNMGSGRGLIIQMQNEYCSSGGTGAGYGISSNPQCSQVLSYFMFLTHSFPYMVKGKYLSSGSGGYGYNNQTNQKGIGGGTIYIFSKFNLTLCNSNLSASGGGVQENDQLSAGSGGTIFLYGDLFSGGQSSISVNGGFSLNNKGAGSGGIVKISAQQINLYQNQIIIINVSQGYQSNIQTINLKSNGIFSGPVCDFGYVRKFFQCIPCKIIQPNSYTSMGNQICLKCPYSPNFVWNESTSNIMNSWECFSDSFQSPYYIWIVPGQIDLISICSYVGLLIIFSIIGIVIRRSLRKKKINNDQINFDFEKLNKQLKEEKILTQKLKAQKNIMPYELIYHVHRITLVGSNSYLCPWVLPLMPPQIIKKYVLIQAYENFAKKFNTTAKWSKTEIFLINLSYLVYPLHWLYYDIVKKRKYKKLCNLLQQSREYNLLNNFDFQDKDLITLKFSKNKDYTSCYIDFFFYQKADLSYYNLSVPFIIYLSGQGNFIRPFYIEQNDPFVMAMSFIVNRNTYQNQKLQKNKVKDTHKYLSDEISDDKQKLFSNLVNLNLRKKNQSQIKKFIIKFNAISCTLDLSSPIQGFIQKLYILTEFIDYWNKKFFNKVKVQIDLVLMISNLLQHNIVSSSIHILSNKNKNEQFLNKLKKIIPRMNLNNQVDMKIGLFIYNPEQKIQENEHKIQKKQQFQQPLFRKSFGQSDDQQDRNISQPLIEQNTESRSESIRKNKILRQKLKQRIYSKLTRFLCLFRYFMLTHQITTLDRYTIKILQSFLILTQTVLVFVWSIKIQIPYIFINLISPFIGILWIVSDSYGFGKLFLIFNCMNLLNQLTTFIIYTVIQDSNSSDITKIVICQSINLILVVLTMIVGSRSITFSKKLRNVQ